MDTDRFTFEGFRIGLRPLTMDDLDAVMAWINEPEVTRNFAGMSATITREQEAAFLARTFASDTERLYAIVDRHGAYLGNAGIHRIYWPARNARLGVVLGAPGARGRGLGREALALLCAMGFTRLGLHKLWVMHYANNDRMAHICRSLGFSVEGTLREEYFHEGRFHDMVRAALLAREYDALAPTWGTIPA